MSLAPEIPSSRSSPVGKPTPTSRSLRQKWTVRIFFVVVVATAIGWRYRVTRPEYRLSSGEEAVQEADWKSAELYAQRLEASGHPEQAHWLRAQMLYARLRLEDAVGECLLVGRDGPYGLRATTLAGRCLLEQGNLVGADQAFRFVLAADPDSVDAHRGVAAIAYDLGQMERAIDHLEHVIRLDPQDARPHRFLGEIYRDMANPESSVAEFQEALRLVNGLSANALDQIRFEVAHGLVQRSRHAEALVVLDEAAADGRPEPPYMQGLRAEALRGLGRRSEAIVVADRALAENPNEGAFQLLRGQLYLDAGNAEAAVPLLERSAALSPHHYQSFFLLAQAYAGTGRTADADRTNTRAEEIRKDYDTVTALGREAADRPWDAAIRIRLAEYCERTGDASGAAMWRKAAAACAARKP
jgi:tetratricopeptide (TPR) repeat protein